MHRTGISRLFQVGFDRKVVKEYSGHRSDAIDKYQVTSENQKQQISKVLASEMSDKCDSKPIPVKDNIASNDQPKSSYTTKTCTCENKTIQINECGKITEVVNGIVKSRKGKKTVVKIEFEFCDD